MHTSTRADRNFLAVWTVVTTISWPIAVFVSIFVALVIGMAVAASYGQVIISPDPAPSTIVEIPFITQLLTVMFVGACMGTPLGILQWLVLQRKFSISPEWIILTILGTTIAYTISMVTKMDINLFYGMLFGLSLGVAQGIAFRPFTRFVMYWIIANTIAWTTSFAVLSGSRFEMIFILPGIIVGLVSGLVLIWYARHPMQKASE